MMIGVYNHLLSKVFRFHYNSQKVIGSVGSKDILRKSFSPIQFDSQDGMFRPSILLDFEGGLDS